MTLRSVAVTLNVFDWLGPKSHLSRKCHSGWGRACGGRRLSSPHRREEAERPPVVSLDAASSAVAAALASGRSRPAGSDAVPIVLRGWPGSGLVSRGSRTAAPRGFPPSHACSPGVTLRGGAQSTSGCLAPCALRPICGSWRGASAGPRTPCRGARRTWHTHTDVLCVLGRYRHFHGWAAACLDPGWPSRWAVLQGPRICGFLGSQVLLPLPLVPPAPVLTLCFCRRTLLCWTAAWHCSMSQGAQWCRDRATR